MKWLTKKPKVRQAELFDIFHYHANADINVLILTEALNATYYLYFDIPLNALYLKENISYGVITEERLSRYNNCAQNIFDIFIPDVLVLSRVSNARIHEIINTCKKKNIPIIYQIDDDLFDLPHSLGQQVLKKHGNKKTIFSRKALINDASMIYASTEVLANKLKTLFQDKKVFTGTSVPYIKPLIKKNKKTCLTKEFIVGYMASKGHQSDLEMVLPDIVKLLTKRKNVKFELFGSIKVPACLRPFGNRITHFKTYGYYSFIEKLNQCNWHLGIAPLLEHYFNRAKSPIKYLEYTACQIPTIASDSEVYSKHITQGGGCLVQDEWYDIIDTYLHSPTLRQDAIDKADEYCHATFNINMYANQLLYVLSDCVRDISL